MTEVILILTGNGVSIVADLYENEVISQSYQFTDISTFQTKGGFSREFNLPASQKNLQFLGDVFNPNITGWADFRRKIPATLSVDTIPIVTGHIQVKRVISENGIPKDISVVLFNENPDLLRSIGDKTLADIVDLPNLNHQLEYTVFADSIAGTLAGGDVIYTLIDKGQKFTEEGNGQPIYDSTNPLYIADLTPCVNGLYLWQQIIADAGFFYEGATIDIELALWWIPWINAKSVRTTLTPDDAYFKAGRVTDLVGITSGFTILTGLTEQYDNGSNFAADQFTAPYTGTFTFKHWSHFTRTAGAGTDIVQVMLRKNGTTIVPNSIVTQIVNTGATNDLYGGPVDVLLQIGDTIEMITNIGSDTYTFEGVVDNPEDSSTGFACVSASYPLQDAEVDMVLNAPAMKQVEFMRSVITMMNLALIADKDSPNKVFVEPLVDYIGSGATLDWTSKLDLAQSVQIYPTNEFQKRNIKFTYKDDGDAMNQFYRDNAGRTYGQFEIRDTGNEFATGDLITQIEFRPTPCNLIPSTNVIVPKFVNQQGEFFKVGPRVLYYAGTTEGVMIYNFDTLTTTATEVILLNHYASYPVNVIVNDLNFGQESPLHTVESFPYNTLYNRYHRRYLREIYGGLGADDLFAQALMMEAFFNLNIFDISKISFADQIYIIDSYWRILEVSDYAVGVDATTRVKLMKVIDVALECDYVPVAVGTGGQVIFADGAGVQVDGSKTCCELYAGYVWNDVVGKCYSNNSPGGPVRPSGTPGPGDPTVVPGAIAYPTIKVFAPYTVQGGDVLVLADATAAGFTITLPLAATMRGRVLIFKKVDTTANVVTIDGNGAELIDRAATTTLVAADQKVSVQSDGIFWATI